MLSGGIRRTVGVGRATIALARSEQITFLAAAIAYYAFASVVPLVVLTAVVASVLGGEALATDLVAVLGSVLTPASQDVLLSTLTTTTGRGSATFVGVVALLWSSLKVFRGLDTAFSLVYGNDGTPGFLDAIVDGVVALAAVGVAIGASVALLATLAFVDLPYLDRAGFVLEVFVLAAAFYPLYYLFPDVDVEYTEAVPGALLAAVGWTAFSGLFRLYAENAESFAVWGVLGAALVVVTWLYVGSILLLVGAAVNAVLAGRALPAVESDVSATVDRHLQSAGLRHTEPAMGDDDREDSRDVDATDEPQDDVETGATDEPRDDADTGGTDEPRDDAAAASATGSAASHDHAPSETSGETDEPDPEALREEIEELRQELESFEDDVDDRTLHRDEIERDLKRYVRRRVRRGKARGWGPYLVLLYGTVMTLGVFYTPYLGDGWAIFAMIVIWLSTLGLYALMLLVGLGVNAVRAPGRLRDAIGDWRS
ncbi:YhjD/YihY/BrkB family envelope integrity protein [Halorubellus litoreus]|uniref:YhjD/YihY/BrkB family envelope integrity protein n=1 Tax=Halorubellus litoreus TaxID=755308 RepID=A0ABD5V973_9EURY